MPKKNAEVKPIRKECGYGMYHYMCEDCPADDWQWCRYRNAMNECVKGINHE